MNLLKLEQDMRRNPQNTEVVIMSPVGDINQFRAFQEKMIQLGMDQDQNVDFLFVTLPKIDLKSECKLSAIIYSENMIELGTSGAFFAGQVQSFNLKYKYTCIADLDAELTSKEIFDKLVQLSKKTRQVAQPLSKARTTSGPAIGGVMNQWTIYPREMFIRYGFYSGFLYKGAEDYDLSQRMKKDIQICKECVILHPIDNTLTPYHKMANKRKMYPYLASLMRAYLLLKDYKSYCLWFSYFCFFADAFGDTQLKMMLKNTIYFDKLNQDIFNDNPYVRITKIRDTGILPSKSKMLLSMMKSILLFLMGKKFHIYTDEIELAMGRFSLFIGLCKAILFIPFRLFEGITNIIEFNDLYRGNITYPIYPKKEDVHNTEKWMLDHFPRQG